MRIIKRSIAVLCWRGVALPGVTLAVVGRFFLLLRRRRVGQTLAVCPSCRARHRTVKNGKAQTRLLHGSLTSNSNESHFKPKHLTTYFWLDRTGSR